MLVPHAFPASRHGAGLTRLDAALLGLAVSLLSACTQATGPGSQNPPPTPASGAAGPASAPPAPSAPPAGGAPSEPAPVNGEANTAIVAAILASPSVQPFLHPEVPGRVPVVLVATNLVASTLQLEAFHQPVRVVTPDEANIHDAHLRLTRLAASPGAVTVSVDYPIEGLVGDISLQRHGSEWRVSSNNLGER